MRSLTLAVMALAVSAAPAAWAGRKGDHDRARAAVLAGEVLPLPTLLERLQRTHPGKVLELELEFEDVADERAAGRKSGRWIYEVKLLQADGQLLKLELDAATAEVLKSKRERGRNDRQRGRDHPDSPPAKDARDAREEPR
ncbi:MAG: PepSY domain-containing protein [Rubrivivax sp.]|nr:PepSY domain-containing protein [Rubrivivax sp.]